MMFEKRQKKKRKKYEFCEKREKTMKFRCFCSAEANRAGANTIDNGPKTMLLADMKNHINHLALQLICY